MGLYNQAYSKISGLKLRKRIRLAKAGRGVAFALVFVFVMLYIVQVNRFRAVQTEVAALKVTRDQLLRQNKNLRIETATLTSPDLVEARGRQLGMRPPDDVQLVLVKRLEQRIKTVPGPEKAEAARTSRGPS